MLLLSSCSLPAWFRNFESHGCQIAHFAFKPNVSFTSALQLFTHSTPNTVTDTGVLSMSSDCLLCIASDVYLCVSLVSLQLAAPLFSCLNIRYFQQPVGKSALVYSWTT